MNETTAPGRAPVRFQRLAEQVADDLRRRILLGDLSDGMALPAEELLRAEYPVSKPTLREAMRVLEAEGLVTVRRGSIGGAVVHRPASANVAYALGLVLASRRIDLNDVASALREVEPSCAAACAERPDRAETVVPELQRIHDASLAAIDDLIAVTAASRQFHETIVRQCGIQSLTIMAGALESVWSTHEEAWALRHGPQNHIAMHHRMEALDEHQALIDCIAAGDADGARHLAATHLATSQTYPIDRDGPNPIDPDAVRHSFVTGVEAADD